MFEKKKCHEDGESQCELTHNQLIEKLKESEMSILGLEEECKSLEREIEETKKCVIEKHREALSWETKWKMAAEAKKQRDEEYANASEIGIMKAEIHRMAVRYAQLKRAQEKLVHDMTNCVQHRDHIYTNANIREKSKDIRPRARNSMQQRLAEARTKLKQAMAEATFVEKQIGTVLSEKEHLERELTKLNQAIEDERIQYSLLQNEIEQAVLLKQEVR